MPRVSRIRHTIFGAAIVVLSGTALGADESTKPASREFEFTYAARVSGLKSGHVTRVWLPVAPSNEQQDVEMVSRSTPGSASIAAESKYGNRVLYFESQPDDGELEFSVRYRVRRLELLPNQIPKKRTQIAANERQLFLGANRRVPVTGRPLELLSRLKLPDDDPHVVARLLYDRVDDHMRYDKTVPGYGNGDSVWACDSRTGNCTDFHSLFISLTRSQGIPARFEIGFPLPVERGAGKIGGYHCWAFFFSPKQGWTPVDISEADKHPKMKEYYFGGLTENRVMFSKGRDLDLVPRQSAGPLNYFVYPHIEVDGRVWPRDKTHLDFRFKDL